MGTYLAWESTATLRLFGGARRGRRGAGYIVSPRAQLVDIDIDIYGTVVTFNIVVSIGS